MRPDLESQIPGQGGHGIDVQLESYVTASGVSSVADHPTRVVPLSQAVRTWCRIAALSFGGPAGQIAVMHRILVEEKRWISEDRFLHALNFCMLLPGPEAQQLATYIGWLLHRTLGGIVAGTLFVIPGIVSILGLSILYAEYQETYFVQAAFFGLKPAVMAIVFEAVLRIGRRVLKNRTMVMLSGASFVAIFFFNVPFPLVVLAAGLTGFVGGRFLPLRFAVLQSPGSSSVGATSANSETWALHAVKPSLLRAVRLSVVFLTLWFAPLVGIFLTCGPTSVFFQEGVFFSKAAVVTFGGAYSVLAYVGQQAVEKFGWLQPGEMLDGLGLAETTPGPLIMVVQFVGFLGAYRNPGSFSPLVAGILGSLLTTWVTFIPCFFWIFLGAPSVERLRGNRLLTSALSAITAAVVGVILNLALWFSVHTLFATVAVRTLYGVRLLVPDLATVRVAAAGLAVLAFFLTFCCKRSMAVTLIICAAAGAGLFFADL